MTSMPRGKSGRIVLEVDPSEKHDLYGVLERDGLTLKEWFLQQARYYVQRRNQPELFPVDPADGIVATKPSAPLPNGQ